MTKTFKEYYYSEESSELNKEEYDEIYPADIKRWLRDNKFEIKPDDLAVAVKPDSQPQVIKINVFNASGKKVHTLHKVKYNDYVKVKARDLKVGSKHYWLWIIK